MLRISTGSLVVVVATLSAVGCRRDRAVSRLDTLPPLTWSSATEAEPTPAWPAPPITATPRQGPIPTPATPVADQPTDPDGEEPAEEQERAAIEEAELPQDVAASEEEESAEVATAVSPQELARLDAIERDNQVLREELAIVAETQQLLAAEIGQLNVELRNLTQLSAVADAYSVEAAGLGMLLGADAPTESFQLQQSEPTVPPGSEAPSATLFGAVPMVPATPTVTAPTAPIIRGPSTPTVLPPAFQFGAPPAVRSQPLVAAQPTNFGATPIPPAATAR